MSKNDEQKDFEDVSEETQEGTEEEEKVTVSVGEYLKTRREARGVSVKTISKDTKISSTKLEFLEKNDFDNLPNKIYVEGYIKSYAKSIGIEPGECLEILHATYRKSPQGRRFSLQEIPKEREEKRTQASYSKVLFAVLGVAFIALVVLIFNYKKSSSRESKSSSVESPVRLKSVDTEASFKMTPNKIVVEKVRPSSADKTVEPEQNPEELAASSPERKVAEVEELSEEKKIDFFPMTGSLYSVDTSVKPEKLAEMIPEQVQRTLTAGKQNIYIKASRGDSWISYKSDNEPIRNLTVKKDQDILIKGQEVRIFFANIKAVDVFLNNRLLSIRSSTGLKSVVFPQENRAKYVRPLFIYHDSGKIETSEEYLSRTGQSQEKENL